MKRSRSGPASSGGQSRESKGDRAAREGEERIRALFSQAAVGIAVSDMDGKLIQANSAYEKITGRTADQLRAVSYMDFTHPDDRALNRELVGRLLRHEASSVTFRKRYIWPGGEIIWARLSVSLIVDDQERPVNLVAVIEDITELMASEERERLALEALRESERRHRLRVTISDAIRDLDEPKEIGLVSCSLTREFLKASRCTLSLMHPNRRTIEVIENATQGVPNMIGEYDMDRFARFFEDFERGLPVAVEDTTTHPYSKDVFDTHYGPLEIRAYIAAPIVRNGVLAGLLAAHSSATRRWTGDEVELLQTIAQRVWDAMERARAIQTVRSSQKRLSQILEAATIGVIVNDPAGKFLYANNPLLRMLGYTKKDLNAGAISWKVIQAPERVETDDKALVELREKGTCEPYETEFVRKDGSRIPVYVGGAFVPDDSGEGLLGAAFVTDLSALKQAERELLLLNSELDLRVQERTWELQRANEEMSAFTYHVSHDLRAPLRAIVGTSRMLQEDFGHNLPRPGLELLQRQIGAANKLGTLMDELLKLTRLSREEPKSEQLDLTALAREVVTEHQSENERVSVKVEEGLSACGDPRLIRLLLTNLISNAFRYSPEGGEVTIGSRQTSNGPAFFVKDQGIGFDMQYSPKLFQPFERLVTEAEFPGTGVGLANVARIVEKHRGDVWAESECGKGATFYFTLPSN